MRHIASLTEQTCLEVFITKCNCVYEKPAIARAVGPATPALSFSSLRLTLHRDTTQAGATP